MTDRSSSSSSFRSRFEELASGVRFGQFASVGVVGAICDNSVLALLKLGFGVTDELAKLAGIETAIVVMFLFNDRWTFAGQGAPGVLPLVRRFLTSNLVRVGGIAVQFVVFYVLNRKTGISLSVGGTDVWFLVASLLAIGVAMAVNYLTESLFTWRVGNK